MFYVESDRLKIIPLTHQQLSLLEYDRTLMETTMGLNPSAMLISTSYKQEIKDALENFWLPQTQAHADKYLWFTAWEIILKKTNTSIGGIGFIGYPNEYGETEMGYMIDKRHHNEGFATEALKAMTEWAFNHEFVYALLAHTNAGNKPSKKTLEKCGFVFLQDLNGLLTYKLSKINY